ncbi:uncharacterized protein AB675_8505 [Cyphellophora attinorum]|uniref:Uncharacterized protein n=1 Tax=Cyphellophora attinorum TaxID=1664694 RepID=A0A0N1HA26_9EURO|nr:uncharacterized protein AB675_8505 [Phialophora attinorum]KPI44613.1 hypothetical protein AB675_8505 [Phialophora attinorum]
MRSILYANLAATACAFPLFARRSTTYNVVSVDGHDSLPQDLQIRNPEPIPASYSVVPVDGGPSANVPNNAPPPPPTATQTETLIATHLATITITDQETPATVVVTVTEPAAAPAQPTVTPPREIVTVTDTVSASGIPQTTPYDNGMWHTTYYYTTVIPTPSSTSNSTPSPTPSTTQQQNWHNIPAVPTSSPSSPPVAEIPQPATDADADPALAGVQLIGEPVMQPPADSDRAAWLAGEWAPWAQGGRGKGGRS